MDTLPIREFADEARDKGELITELVLECSTAGCVVVSATIPSLARYLRIEKRELEAGGIPLSATRGAELLAKSTLPVPPDEPADERVPPLQH